MALLAGAWILSSVIDIQAATAGEIWDQAVQKHGVGVVVVVVTEIEAKELVLETKICDLSFFTCEWWEKSTPETELEVAVDKTDDVVAKFIALE